MEGLEWRLAWGVGASYFLVMQVLLDLDAKLEQRGGGGAPLPGDAHGAGRQRMLGALLCSPVDRPPVWLMRQAGRCLPEYRALKEKYSFRQMLHTPELAAEVTLQPVRRFRFDAAILFSDILVVPEALGQGFSFREGGGIKMDFVLRDRSDVERLQTSGVADRLQYMADAIRLAKSDLGASAALLGFVGSPWTLANFMLGRAGALSLFQRDRALLDALCERLALAAVECLRLQIDAGADAVQIFDSLGGLLPSEDFEAGSGRWMRMMVSGLKGRAPVIVYARGVRNWKCLVETGARAIGIDHEIDLAEARRLLPPGVAIQGNLPPDLLSDAAPALVAAETTRLLELMRGRAGYIFNLGHGVPPDAKLENIEALAVAAQNFQ